MDSQNNNEINNTEIDTKNDKIAKDAVPHLLTQLHPLKITLLYKDIFNQYITKIIELKKYSENDTLKDISKKINVAYRRVDTKHSTTCAYMFLYEGKRLPTDVELETLLSMQNLNFNRDEPIIALLKQPSKIPMGMMSTMLELFGGLSSAINGNDDNNDNNNDGDDNDDNDNESEDYSDCDESISPNCRHINDNNNNDNNENNDNNDDNYDSDEGEDVDVNTSINGGNFQENMITLTNMGFTNEDSIYALVSSGGSLDLAVSLLIPG